MKVLVEKAALDALLKTAMPAHEGNTDALAQELSLDDLLPEALAVARARKRAKRGESHIDPLDQLVQVVFGLPESMNLHIKAQVAEAGTNVQAYTRAVMHLAMRAGLMDRVTAAMRREAE
ncbi:hypothetical protein R70006_06311 [Paraburkholderia domus]|uniref:hypothetical protein n=1 Tax=Paraburkholderia domus TaxID=2793075 RepID=UPI0019147076|nr:hypothetical protein [Paraburkholderia domus]MBK5052937.1 hypothetical protein [Burkholderia sp. R-70006]CAE6823308.1 hypothetical protein R70006_06311 [Paraburkholderia domus]